MSPSQAGGVASLQEVEELSTWRVLSWSDILNPFPGFRQGACWVSVVVATGRGR